MSDENVSSTPSVNPSVQDAPAAPAFADTLMGVTVSTPEEILAASASQIVAALPPVQATNTGLKASAVATNVATKDDIAELKEILSRYGIA